MTLQKDGVNPGIYSDYTEDDDSGFGAHIQYHKDQGENEVSGWFLGARAENVELFSQLIQQAINVTANARRSFHPEDPSHITEEVKVSSGYLSAVQSLKDNFSRFTTFLQNYSTPFYSMRYQGHMLWDTTMPALIGYFTAMLHNPNNVTIQASTATTYLEYLVGKDLCNMIGYDPASSWAHITCDGTVANLEAMWAAREVKFFPFGIKEALEKEHYFTPARSVTVTLPDGAAKELTACDSWELMNLERGEILSVPNAIAKILHKKESHPLKYKTLAEVEAYVWNCLVNYYSLNAVGLMEFTRRHLQDVHPPVVLVPSTRHYSWPKAAAVLGLGYQKKPKNKDHESITCDGGVKVENLFYEHLINIPVDETARMDTCILEKVLDHCRQRRIPILMAVSVMGSTEESAVDPLNEIRALQMKFQRNNLNFDIHADAAWGGYLLSVLRRDFDSAWPDVMSKEPVPGTLHYCKWRALWTHKPVPLSAYVTRQMKHIRHCDSVTIDPHKWGYIPYPAGSLCYRDDRVIKLLGFTAPYIQVDENADAGKREQMINSLGEHGIEGSKPGAAPAAVFLSHSVIRPSEKGYGKIIRRSLINAKMLYVYMLFMRQEGEPFFVVPLHPLPKTPPGEAPMDYIKKHLYNKSLEEMREDEEAWKYFTELGADQNILNYAFNYYTDPPQCTRPNRNMTKINTLNQLIYDQLHVIPGEKVADYDLLVTMTTFYRGEYYKTFMDSYARRLQAVDYDRVNEIKCFRSVIMDPWMAETKVQGTRYNFIQAVIIPKLRQTVLTCVNKMREQDKLEEKEEKIRESTSI